MEIIKTQCRAILYKSHSASTKSPYFTTKEVFVYSENYGMYLNWLSALFTNPFLIVPMLAYSEMRMKEMTRLFIYIMPFRNAWKAMGLTDKDWVQLEEVLLENSQKGDVIEGTGGARKLRV